MTRAGDATLERFLARLLRRSPLNSEEQAAILRLRGHVVQATAQRDIITPGQETGSACLVADGMVARLDEMANGVRQITALYISGDMCDLHSVAAPVAGWGLQALTTTTVLRILHSDLRELAVRYPTIAFAFWRDMAVDASVLAKWVSNIRRNEARPRLAHLLCEIGVRSEHAGIGSRTDFLLPMTQIQIADALGLTSVHVNRTMKALRRDTLVALDGRRVRVERWNDLADVAAFDPRFLLIEPRPDLIIV